jgi:hypothetical protein
MMTTEVNGLIPYTFKSTGVNAFVRPIPPYLLRSVGKAFDPPKPPTETIALPDGTTREEQNKAHPEYIAALEEYSNKINEALADLIAERGVVIKLTKSQLKDVQELREYMRSRHGVDIGNNNESAYIRYFALGTPQDIVDLIKAVTQASVPTDPKSQSG